MKILDRTFLSPADDLACDEALLEESEISGGGELLRFWQPKKYFAVLGYSNAWREEVKASSRVPVYRRCSGGGTVLQGPGCLNYSLILRIEPGGPLESIRSTNAFILQRHREALQELLKKEVGVQGYTDLTLGALKFSGNSQRRKRNRLLFHGTFLLDFELPEMDRCLKLPAKQPAYRQGRGHSLFVTNLGIPAQKIKQALAKTWNAGAMLTEVPEKRIEELVNTRYSRDEWNRRF